MMFFVASFLGLLLSACGVSAGKDVDAITVWHWMSDRDEVFQELAAQYEKETGTKVRFDLYAPSEAYAQRVKASAQTNTLPDVFGILGEKRDFASFIKSGYVANLISDLEAVSDGTAWKNAFFEKALEVNQFLPNNEYSVEPGIYGVPLDVMTIQMVYNQGLYEKAGLDPSRGPETFEEMLAHGKALKEKGIPGFVCGFGEIWLIESLANVWAMNVMGEEKVFDTYRGKVPYTDPDWVRVLSAFKQMADAGLLVDGTVTMVNKTAEQTFANERAAWAFNGSWCINVYKGMNPNLRYGAMLPPKLSAAHPMRVWGGAGGSLMVNAKSERKEEAVKFLRWLTSNEVQSVLAAKTENLPSNKAILSQVSPILAQFADDMEVATHPNVFPIHESPSVTEAFDKGVQSILIGEKSPEEVAAEVQRMKEKEMKKAERS